ncbi:uncharacterized protein TNCV_3285481 [Trichonephila clavipes]|nr:uncharacterized protein TNCV_3285481 [Trichonephila clavipes]
MVYIYNIFFAKKDFTFGLRTVKSGEIHLIQTTHVPMLIYELPASSLKCRAQPNVIRRSFEPHDQMLYHRTILEPHTAFSIPAGTNYIVLTVQKTAFGLYIIPESLLPELIQKGLHVGDFRKMKKFDQTPYKLPPPTPIHVPAKKRPLEEKSLPFSKKRSKVRITPVMRRVSRRSELPMAPVQISQPPVQIPDVLEPVQIPLVPQSSLQIPVSLVIEPPVQIPPVPQSPVQIPDVPEQVQIPVSKVPQSPVQIPLVQIPDVPEHVQIPESNGKRRFKQVNKHAAQKYNLDCRKQCLFCFGRKHWPYGEKNRAENVNHVTACLQRFVEDAKIHEETEEEETEEVVCGCRHFRPVPRGMRGRRKDRFSEYVGFYDSLLEKREMWEEWVTFQNGLGKDMWGMVQRYLRQDLMWFHIMVKHDVFDTFRKEMEKIRDQCVILPFWCLCDGLVNEKGKIQHRRMILACEQESPFEDVWKGKIRYEFPNSGRAKKCIKIKNAFHLVWSIMRDRKILLEQLGNKNVAKWEKTTRRRADAWGHFKWSVPIHVTGWKFLNCVIPYRYEETEE